VAYLDNNRSNIVLVVPDIGIQAFLSGLWTGAQKVSGNPVVQNVTGEAKEFVNGSNT
jgi:hypothetical protein